MRKKRPDVRWRGHYDVPVHRLLWPVFKPQIPLRPEERLRKRDLCPDEFFYDCVNPEHFEIAIPMTDRRPVTLGRQNNSLSGYTAYIHDWTVDSISPHDDLLHCPLGHRFPRGVQNTLLLKQNPKSDMYQDSPHGRSQCNECHDMFLAQRGRRADGKAKRRPRGVMQPNNEAREQKINYDIYQFEQRQIDRGNISYGGAPQPAGDSEIYNDLDFPEPDN